MLFVAHLHSKPAINPLSHSPKFNDPVRKRFQKTLWEKKNDGNLLPQCFLPFFKQIQLLEKYGICHLQHF